MSLRLETRLTRIRARYLRFWNRSVWEYVGYLRSPIVICDSNQNFLEIGVGVPALSPPDTVNYTRPNSVLQCGCNVPVFKYVLLSGVGFWNETDEFEGCSIVQACVECQGGNTTTYVFVLLRLAY